MKKTILHVFYRPTLMSRSMGDANTKKFGLVQDVSRHVTLCQMSAAHSIGLVFDDVETQEYDQVSA